LEDLGVDGRAISKCIKVPPDETMDYIDLNQDREQWRSLVNTLTRLWIS